ncbi:two-component system response regulator BtsR [Deefgea rivuli]|uniref:two-component system response regulator BtsR n=1 Tax=Deefgea rivuli TaxID=400948 RepID=UPI0004817883|nr:two-component system response regulator BtsR [Deefgea rivuli]
MRALLVDDEPLARDELRNLLAAAGVDVIGEASNAIEAMQGINQLRPDVVFLDIQMPRISGLELVGMLDPERMPFIVFVTAFDEHAVQAFEEHAFDYLLKPVAPLRLAKTLARLQKPLTKAPPDYSAIAPQQALKNLPCHRHDRILLLPLDDIEYVIARLSGIYLITKEGNEHYTELTLKTLEEKTCLLRCHRQHLVHPEKIAEIVMQDNGGADLITRSGLSVPVSRRFLKPLKEQLGVLL